MTSSGFPSTQKQIEFWLRRHPVSRIIARAYAGFPNSWMAIVGSGPCCSYPFTISEGFGRVTLASGNPGSKAGRPLPLPPFLAFWDPLTCAHGTDGPSLQPGSQLEKVVDVSRLLISSGLRLESSLTFPEPTYNHGPPVKARPFARLVLPCVSNFVCRTKNRPSKLSFTAAKTFSCIRKVMVEGSDTFTMWPSNDLKRSNTDISS